MASTTFSGPVRSLNGLIPSGSSLTLSKLMSARASLNFPSIASNTQTDLTITVIGAKITDFAVSDLPSALTPGLVFNMFVSAPDLVTVRASNLTLTAIDPPALTFGVLVISVL